MIAPLAKLIDWSVLQARVTLNLLKSGKPHTNGRSPRLEEALQFLKGPDFIPAESRPAPVEFNPDMSGVHFQFPRRDPETVRRTTSFMAGFTVARDAGRNDL